MTKEEAIKWLDKLYMGADITDEYGDMMDMQPYEEAFNMAIKALEQESCDDAISREQAMAIIYKIKENYTSDRENHPINYGTLCDINLQLVNLPSVTPKEKTGHWITDIDRWGDIVTTVNGYRCDKCNTFNSDKDNYCPNCGARMVEPQEGEK